MVHENLLLQGRIRQHHFARREWQQYTIEQAAPFRPRQDARDGMERLRHLHSSLVVDVPA